MMGAIVEERQNSQCKAPLPTNYDNLMFIPNNTSNISIASSLGVKQISWYQKRTSQLLLTMKVLMTPKEWLKVPFLGKYIYWTKCFSAIQFVRAGFEKNHEWPYMKIESLNERTDIVKSLKKKALIFISQKYRHTEYEKKNIYKGHNYYEEHN